VNRRSASWIVRILVAVAALSLPGAPSASAAPPDPVPVASDDVTVDTANPFVPEDVDLTTCVGTLQRPGCGSESRGGWHQNLVAIAMVGGLLLVFGRIAWGVRRSQKRPAPHGD
jgi:hypothetical protein